MYVMVFIIMSCISVFSALVMVFVVFLFFIVPINMAIENAPASLYSINQTVLVVIGAAITYNLYRKKNSSSNIIQQLVKANKDYLMEQGGEDVQKKLDKWNCMEATDKEVEMGKLMIMALHNHKASGRVEPPNGGQQPSGDEQPFDENLYINLDIKFEL